MVKKTVKKIVVGDIGGTNTSLGLFDPEADSICDVKKLKTKELNLESELLRLLENKGVEGISLAVAGPVFNGSAELTNVDKEIDSSSLSKKLSMKVNLINDFESLGHYAKSIGKKRCLVIGAGTGLGKVMVSKEVLSSEGGHQDFPFKKEEDLKDFFLKKLNRFPQYEDLVSGRGLSSLKEFHAEKELSREDLLPNNIFLKKDDALNKKAISDFSRFYARFIRNSFIDFLPEEVLISGGIAKKNPWILETKEFLEELNTELIIKPKISLIKDEYPGLRGAGFAFNHKNI